MFNLVTVYNEIVSISFKASKIVVYDNNISCR